MAVTTLINKLFTKKKSPNLLAVALRHDVIAYCFYPKEGDIIEHEIAIEPEQHLRHLSQLHDNKALTASCHLVLSPKQYQIVQVDKPNVPADELLAALKWSIKDQVNFPVDDVTLDYFDAPLISGQQKINVVCAQHSILKKIVLELHQQDINLTNITVEEFSFTQLLGVENDAKLLVCQQPNEDIIILIVKAGQLFSHRRLRGTAKVGLRSVDELSMGIIDNLSIEIQKSIDFFERQLKQSPVKSIQVLLPVENEAFIARKLSENTHLNVELLTLPKLLSKNRSYAISGCLYPLLKKQYDEKVSSEEII